MRAQLLHGDSLEVLASMPNGSITAVVTDGPYGIRFMGEAWDHFDIERVNHQKNSPRRFTGSDGLERHTGTKAAYAAGQYDRSLDGARAFQAWCETWGRECLRLLKPGGVLLSFGSPRLYHRMTSGLEDAGFEIRDCLSWLHGAGFPKSLDLHKATGDPEWRGYGTALKPAWEPIVLAMKPRNGTFAQNALAHGVAGVNVNGCRVGDGHSSNDSGRDGEASAFRRYSERGSTNLAATPGPRGGDPSGRFPANLILDEAAGAMLDAQSGELTTGAMCAEWQRNGGFAGARACFGKAERGGSLEYPANSGGASRFFYCAKASRADRSCGGSVENVHPTVKPLNLMRWLVRMVRMPDDATLILDPFAGSGTTLLAAEVEGVRSIGIEREEAYLEVARARLAALERDRDGALFEDAFDGKPPSWMGEDDTKEGAA